MTKAERKIVEDAIKALNIASENMLAANRTAILRRHLEKEARFEVKHAIKLLNMILEE